MLSAADRSRLAREGSGSPSTHVGDPGHDGAAGGGGGALADIRSEARPSLRVLCLHDARSDAAELSHRLDTVAGRLWKNHGIDLVFVDGPLPARSREPEPEPRPPGSPQQRHGWDGRNSGPRVWWEESGRTPRSSGSAASNNITGDGENGENGYAEIGSNDCGEGFEGGEAEVRDVEKTNARQYVGLDASLLLLRQIWASEPFWGIIAFGQAASVASFLPLMPVSPLPGFCIFVEGTTILDEQELLMIDPMPCLHIVGTNPSIQTMRLVQQFGGEVSSGTSPFSTLTMNRIGKFLVARKRDLRNNHLDVHIWSLQNQLYRAEQDAAHLVALQIANAPPTALLAVISPKNVGGFSGARRRGPDEDGGGAPCPSDFLLHREKRSDPPNGPTRHHPGGAGPPAGGT